MKIVGLDADSKKIAIVCFNNNQLLYHELLISHSKDAKQRLYDLIMLFERQIKAIKPQIVYIEEAIFIQNFKTSRAIAEVIGNIKVVLSKYKIDYETVPVNSWKKAIIGKGNASKDEVREFILNKYPDLEGCEQDIFDATAICLFGVENEYRKKVSNS